MKGGVLYESSIKEGICGINLHAIQKDFTEGEENV